MTKLIFPGDILVASLSDESGYTKVGTFNTGLCHDYVELPRYPLRASFRVNHTRDIGMERAEFSSWRLSLNPLYPQPGGRDPLTGAYARIEGVPMVWHTNIPTQNVLHDLRQSAQECGILQDDDKPHDLLAALLRLRRAGDTGSDIFHLPVMHAMLSAEDRAHVSDNLGKLASMLSILGAR